MAKRRVRRSNFSWSFFIILLVSVLVLGILIIMWSINRPFCANSLSCKESLSLKVENGAAGVFEGRTVKAPNVDLSQASLPSKVLGEDTGEKHIYVDLGTQTLTAYQGDTVFMQAPVSTGKWFPTPTGDFRIWEKIRATRMAGGEGADYYNLPNVPFVMFFSNDKVSAGRGFSLHGAYWHDNFGHPMSHGCVNMRQVDAEKLYYWVNPVTTGNYVTASKDDPGTKITIYGQAPI